MGGRVLAGSDPGYIFQTYGFGFIAELEMLQEVGLTPPETIRAATLHGALTLYEAKGVTDPPLGMVRVGKLADLVIVDDNPLANLKVLYGTACSAGASTPAGSCVRTRSATRSRTGSSTTPAPCRPTWRRWSRRKRSTWPAKGPHAAETAADFAG
jgi:hypothetical protein